MADLGFLENVVRDLSVNAHFRGVLQPLVAIILGVRLGLTEERPQPSLHRASPRWQSARELAFPLAVALAIDGILQYLTLGWVRPGAALVVGVFLAWVPFELARVVTAHLWNRPRTGRHTPQPT